MKILKKASLLLLLVASMLFCLLGFVGCSETKPKSIEVSDNSKESSLVLTEKIKVDDFGSYSLDVYICYDKETKVMYVISYAYQGGVSIEVMRDKDGNPKLYKG